MGTLVLLSCLLGSGYSALAQEDRMDEEPVEATLSVPTRPQSLPAASEPDTVRTNIWLTEALMGEIATRASRVLPGGPSAIRLMPGVSGDSDEMLTEAMVRVLGSQGHTLFLPDEDQARQAAVDHVITFHVVGVELGYPDVGRTLGVWRQWIARELSVTAQVEVSDANSGRILLSDRITRTYNDRVSDGDFDDVNSTLYDFSTAETQESGWQRRMEEIVVLGTLAGLVAVYFANTTD